MVDERDAKARQSGLTPEAFALLLKWLDSEPERAGEQYERMRRKLIEFFEHHRCSISAELADAAFDRIGHKLAAGDVIRTSNHSAYCYGVARNIMREYWRRPEREQFDPDTPQTSERLAAESIAAQRAEQTEVYGAQRLECLDHCLQRLAQENRELIEIYYRGEEVEWNANRHALARQLGISYGNLRIRAHRIRRDLEQCVQQCIRQVNS